ncbi:B-cell antigen receptor complex-associated protein alpha chain isoform X1 [Bufo bufo]|uniref:B-cell antigen receptor complex-associated protein alpha chain isoform X1 n=1 Tax=Bufo bufo TaxID=8384 RepID=UPI001ABDAE03|nr:B-cell antigen receptor complex-associated protein alpha chain isoform X1 [Bufo bufo]
MNAPHATWTAPIVTLLILLPVPRWALEMQWVPTSISILPGEDATIPCNFHRKHNENVNISWVLIQRQVNKTDDKSFIQMVQKKLPHAMRNLTIRNAAKTDSGIYLCRVTAGSDTKESCGTYLRVRELPVFLFFNVAEATKNRLITAEGIILLLCAIIPGTFLLYKKRMENLNSLSLKEVEGENLYEGLNLEDCSMYEDISRGLQATYEDVGTFRAGDIHLEKP